MELDEFHVGQADAGPMRDGEPVAGRHLRIGRISVDLTASTGRKHRDIGDNLNRGPGDASSDSGAAHAVGVLDEEQVQHSRRLLHRDSRRLTHLGDQRACHLSPGLIAVGVDDAMA